MKIINAMRQSIPTYLSKPRRVWGGDWEFATLNDTPFAPPSAARTKDRRTDAHIRRAELDRKRPVGTHAHRQLVDLVALGDDAEQGEMRRDRLVRRRNGHQSLDRQPVSTAAEQDEGVGVLRKDPRLLRLPAGVDFDEQAGAFADPLNLPRQRRGDLLPVDGLDDVEGLDRLPRLVALQRSDQMKFDRLAERG